MVLVVWDRYYVVWGESEWDFDLSGWVCRSWLFWERWNWR